MKEALPWLVCWARFASLRNFSPALAALVGPVHLSVHGFPLPSKLDRQSCRAAYLLICVSGSNKFWEWYDANLALYLEHII
jgi:hypothetical protein